MNFQLGLFYVFSSVLIFAALFVISAKNPVHAVLSVVLTFVCMAANWLLLEAEFLSIALILIYVGAVMVLFLFVVMMIHLEAPEEQRLTKYWPIGVVLAGALVMLLLLAILPRHFDFIRYTALQPRIENFSNVRMIGNLLYNEYLLEFEIAGVILLVAMLAAIGLTFRGPRGSKTQQVALQVQVKKSDRLKIIHLPSSIFFQTKFKRLGKF